ncbi:MAG: type II toxin-antitoxin system HicA family toxin [Lachnospiraceae bacterium]|nr:type II toxin-antitoxin system HicA family toxin [Lachnospiraceae bacterium]
MKRTDLIEKLEDGGFIFERHGSGHDIYVRDSVKETVPRHREINEQLAKAILRRNGLL